MQNYSSKLKIVIIFSVILFGVLGLAKISWATIETEKMFA